MADFVAKLSAMPDDLIRHRWSRSIWWGTVVLGFAYWLGALARSGIAFHGLADLPLALLVPWKGACTLGLAVSVALASQRKPTRLFALALMISAVADMLLPIGALVLSGLLFSISHLIAIIVFWRNRAGSVSALRRIAAFAAPILTSGLSVLALYGTGQPMIFVLYPFLSGIMATTAILSRFPIWLSGLGAAIFVCSDVLVLAWMGVWERDNSFNFLTWLTYFGGYALLARGAMLAAAQPDQLR